MEQQPGCPFCGGPIASYERNETDDYETTAFVRIAELEAELAALKARRCGTCVYSREHWGRDWCEHPDAPEVMPCTTDLSCNRWLAKR